MDRRFQSYYTKSDPITDYMVAKLDLKDSDSVLEPSGGEGHFIDAMLRSGFAGEIETFEIDEAAHRTLIGKFRKLNVRVNLSDTLWDRRLDEIAREGGGYDKIIGNPPYGAWLELDERTKLKEKFDGIYARETYALFLYRCISLLKPNGRLCFIVPDTFLFLHNHTKLRKAIFERTIVEEILIFRSRLFPGIAFGYSNLSIITLRKTAANSDEIRNEVIIRKGFRSAEEFSQPSIPEHVLVYTYNQAEILRNPHAQLVLEHVGEIVQTATTTLGDLAECVTGLYTGDNSRFIASISSTAKGIKNYSVVSESLVDFETTTLTPLRNGKKYLPLVKGSSATRYIRKENPWVVQWDEEAHKFYSESKKARFQNSIYYFRKGIAVPMVKSQKIRVTEFKGCVFDQSIVGIFAKDSRYHDFILAFLNTQIATKLIHIVNPTANNSANYLKRLPIPIPSESQLKFVQQLMQRLRLNPEDSQAIRAVEEYFQEVLTSRELLVEAENRVLNSAGA